MYTVPMDVHIIYLLIYEIYYKIIIFLCYFGTCLLQHFFKIRRYAQMRVHVSLAPWCRAWHHRCASPDVRDPLWPIAAERGQGTRLSWSRTPRLFLIGGADVRVPAESLCGGVEKRKYNNHGRRETQGEWRLKTKGSFIISYSSGRARGRENTKGRGWVDF